MALKLYERYPQLWESPSNDYPQGAFKNLSAQGETDGSYLEQDWLNDYSGFFGALLRNAEMTPDGTIDTAQKSQFYDALIKVAKSAVADQGYATKTYVDNKFNEVPKTEIINNWDQASDENVFSAGFVKDRVVNEWGDSPNKVLSQKFLSDENENINNAISSKTDTSVFNNAIIELTTDINKKASMEYVDSSVAAVAGGSKSYKTLTEAESDKENIPSNSSVYITNDGELTGLYNFNDGVFTKSEYDPLTQSKNYTDSLVKNVTQLPDNTDLNSILEVGTYFLRLGNNYLSIPSGIDLTSSSFVLRVLPASGAYYTQLINPLTEPYKVYSRSIHRKFPGVWMPPFYRYNGAYDNIDPLSILEDGNYVVTNPLNIPSSITGSVALSVNKYGGFTSRVITFLNNPNIKYEKINGGIWVKSSPFDLGTPNLSNDFAYRTLVTDYDLNLLVKEGRYIATGNYTNNPQWLSSTLFIDVQVYGSFVIQQVRTSANMDQISQRRGISTPSENSWQEWNKIGGSTSGSASNLVGKRIAFIGDSIVEGGNYPEYIGQRFDSIIHKFGFGGCRASRYSSNLLGYDPQCLYNIAKCINTGDYSSLIAGAEYTRVTYNDNNVPQATAMSVLDWENVDILCIAFGTNDWTSDNGLGDSLTPDPEGKTYNGAMCFAIEEILKKYPNLQIILLGVTFRLRLGEGTTEADNSDNTLNSFGESLIEYQDALFEISKKYHVPVMDMYRNSGINEFNYQVYLQDGIHPKRDSGYRHWAAKIGSFLNANI